MKISGFTFIRNGNKLGYPYLASIQSISSICDEIIVVMLENLDKLVEYNLLENSTPFIGTHPVVMQSFVAKMNWKFNYDPSQMKVSTKDKLSSFVERLTGKRIGEYKNYILLK